MDPRIELSRLGEPDLAAVDRVWTRFRATRARAPRPQRPVLVGALALASAGLLAVWATRAEAPRALALDAPLAPAFHDWSEQVRLVAHGRGVAAGTSRDVEIDWASGDVRVEVAPHTGTAVRVVTEEALVEVVGTVFTVDRGALGSTVSVERGKVRVACQDGWSGVLEAGAAHTCLPTTAAGLLGRAEALLDDAGAAQDVMDALDRGVRVADAGPVRGELLARRMHQRAGQGDVDGALADATRYLESPSGRTAEVQRFAAWLSLSERGCGAATPWLTLLHEDGSGPDTVLLAECLAAEDPERARALIAGARPRLDDTWSERADRVLAALGGEAPQ